MLVCAAAESLYPIRHPEHPSVASVLRARTAAAAKPLAPCVLLVHSAAVGRSRALLARLARSKETPDNRAASPAHTEHTVIGGSRRVLSCQMTILN